MDFLTTALYTESPEDSTKEKFSGALLTYYNPEDFLSRAHVYYSTKEGIVNREHDMTPCGFDINSSGVLLSDTACRKVFTEQMTDYICREFEHKNDVPVGLIDIVLYGANYGGKLVVNTIEWGEGAEPITVSMSNLRVSNSTFNIYASYLNSEEKFRTYSLIDITTDEPYTLTMLIPDDEVDKFEPFVKYMVPSVGLPEIEGYQSFVVNAPLLPYPTFTGEGFCNYLAYNVGFFTMGMKIIEQFLSETKHVSDFQAVRDEEIRARKIAKHNVSIEATFKKPQIQVILNRLDKPDELMDLRRNSLEAEITYIWLHELVSNQDKVAPDADGNRLTASCISLRSSCRRYLLHFSAELLAQRLYINSLGPSGDTLPPGLKGGGVCGCSIKRTTW